MDEEWISGPFKCLTGRVQVGDENDPVVAAVKSRQAFESGLRSIGLPDSQVAQAVSLRDETDIRLREIDAEIQRYHPPGVRFALDPTPPGLYSQRNSVWRRFADWFSNKKIEVLEAADTEVRVPLFILGCAEADGCTATFDREEMKGRSLSWNMTLYGNGASGSRELSASASATFTAAAGQTKVVFVPLTLTLQRIIVLEADRPIATGIQVDSSSVRADSSPGLRVLPPETRLPAGPAVQRFPLAGDTTGALATYQWTYQQTSEKHLEIGLEAFNSKMTLSVGTELTTLVTLKYELRGGYDYILLSAAEGDGLLWAPPRRA